MTWFQILFVVGLPCVLGASTLTLLFLWADAKAVAEYNLNGWNRACYFLKEAADQKLMWEKACSESDKRANAEEARADAYLARLQKFGLEEQS